MMDNMLAIEICEGLVTADNEEQIEAWQHLIDTALVWQLQGWYGRTATRLIEEGICNAPEWAND
jgi:hypothetical protein